MASHSRCLSDYPTDVLLLILEQLVHDGIESLNSISLTCHALRKFSLPYLLRNVDLSSHNNGRQPDREDEITPEVHADFSDEYRSKNLVSRQRAFLRLITERTELAAHVQSLTWTLIWMDFEDQELKKMDYELWNVFSRFTHVSRLDLASIHQISQEPFIRQNPSKLFPAVRDLRLLGWMHRGLVEAILTSVDLSKFASLKLDFLHDEGALPRKVTDLKLEYMRNASEFPGGIPMSNDLAKRYAHTYSNLGHPLDYRSTIDAQLYKRQQTGEACIFPAPMWYPLRLLSTIPCTSITNFELRLAPYDSDIDLRSYFTMFDETANFLTHIKDTLKTLTLVFADHPFLHNEPRGMCGTSRNFRRIYRRENITLVADFLRQLLPVLNKEQFSSLKEVTLEGFHILEGARPLDIEEETLRTVRKLVQSISLADEKRGVVFIKKGNVDHRPAFNGYDCYSPIDDELDEIMDES